MNTIRTLLAFVNAFQLETGTAPTMAIIAERFDWNDLTWWLNHLSKRLGYLIEHMLTYAITAEGLDSLQKSDGTLTIVSGEMIITCPSDEDYTALQGYLLQFFPLRRFSEFQAGTTGRFQIRQRNQYPAYFSQWFPTETAANFRK